VHFVGTIIVLSSKLYYFLRSVTDVVGKMKYVVYCRRKQILFEVLLKRLNIKCPAVDLERTQETTFTRYVRHCALFARSFKCVYFLPYTGHSQYQSNKQTNISCAHINLDKILFTPIHLTLPPCIGRARLYSGKFVCGTGNFDFLIT
jgi:hypothetical protein